MSGIGELKAWMVATSGVSDTMLHIAVGMILLIGFAVVLHRPFWTWRPWLAVLVIELINEVNDLRGMGEPGEAGFQASWHDIKATMLIPTLLLVATPLSLRAVGYRVTRKDRA